MCSYSRFVELNCEWVQITVNLHVKSVWSGYLVPVSPVVTICFQIRLMSHKKNGIQKDDLPDADGDAQVQKVKRYVWYIILGVL